LLANPTTSAVYLSHGLYPTLTQPSAVEAQSANKSLGKKVPMFLILAIVLVILWIGGFTVMHVSSLFIHLLLLFAIISVIMHFVTGRRSA
jgi:hypothetical protein